MGLGLGGLGAFRLNLGENTCCWLLIQTTTHKNAKMCSRVQICRLLVLDD